MRICPRCQHVNPDEAAFCYFDGLALRTDAPPIAVGVPLALPVDAGPPRLPHEFVFPAGRRCLTYDDFVQGCLEDWPGAGALLAGGAFKHYFTGAGRLDLVRAADEAVRQHADADLALDAFLAKLPATKPPKPELELNPHKLILGALAVGETRQAQLVVENVGTGLLHGTLNVVDGGSWLRLARAGQGTAIALKVARTQTVEFVVQAQGLPAPMKAAARLTVITNGGIVEVPVRLDVTPQPFNQPPYVGALTPRDLAVRMRDNPKPAIPMFESGGIPRWFEVNAWGYPVIGPTAPGMAAVQQFFEALGLARPPRVQLDETEANFSCVPGEPLAGRVGLSTGDRKWIYAHARCAAPWLHVVTPAVSGPQQTGIEFEVNTRALGAERGYDATVEIVANGGQRLTLTVRVQVRPREEPAQPPLPPRPEPAPAPRRPPAESPVRWRVRRPILAAALVALALRLLLAGPADLYARVLAGAPGERAAAGSFASWREPPVSAEFVRHFVVATGWLGALLGLVVVARRGRLRDLPFGIIAGAAGGLAASGTLACLLPVLDWPARQLWGQLTAWAPVLGASGWSVTAAWVALAAACWALAAAAGAVVYPRR